MKLIAAILLLCSIAGADEATKTPGLRELETDRPDKTESTMTVDKGHFQLEVELASFTQSASNANIAKFGDFELRYGLTNSVDLQVQFDPYDVEEPDGAVQAQSRGNGDTVLRVKWNWAGNDGSRPGFALLPFIKLPTAKEALGNGFVEGGLIVPMKLILPYKTEVAFEIEYARTRNKNGSANSELTSAYSFDHALWTDNVHGYVELYSQSAVTEDWVATIDTGFTWQVGANNQFDGGVNIGVTPAADPWNPFVGYSVRF